MFSNIFDPILDEKFVAKWIDTSCPTLQRQRSDGSGPPFVQLSARRIGYRKSAIEKWLAERTINRVGELVIAKQLSDTRARSQPDPSAVVDDAKCGGRGFPAYNARANGGAK
jgi:predicted DNA-binding transcriptional regulator AlpA